MYCPAKHAWMHALHVTLSAVPEPLHRLAEYEPTAHFLHSMHAVSSTVDVPSHEPFR